jgi:COP9 signalosome complex subunit 2
MSESEEYEFEYSEEEEELDDEEVKLENLYYDSKSILEEEKDKAEVGFRKIIESEQEPSIWSFKALKKLCKVYCFHLENEKLISTYQELLRCIKRSVVTRAVSEKGINSILNKLQKNIINNKTSWHVFEKIYEMTLEAAKEIRNDRLWIKTYLTLGNLYAEMGQFDKLTVVLRNLHNAHENAKQNNNNNNNDNNNNINNNNKKVVETIKGTNSTTTQFMKLDVFNGTVALEIHALQILLYTAQKDNVKLKSLYEKSLQIRGTVPHPHILGVIRECGGKMHMREKLWDSARRDFFEAFKSYDEAGDNARIRCLKYLVLANMLMGSKINPFTSQEAKPYEFHPEIKAMTQLVKAHDNNEIQKFELILKRNRKSILNDDFIKLYVEELLQTVRIKVILKTIKPYDSIRVQYLASILDIDEVTLYELLVTSIMDGVIDCKIDQVNGMIILNDRNGSKAKHSNEREKALLQWIKVLKKNREILANKSTNFVLTN